MAPVVGGHDPLVCRPEQAVQDIKSGDRVFVQGIAATPTLLTKALAERGKQVHRRFTQALDTGFPFHTWEPPVCFCFGILQQYE